MPAKLFIRYVICFNDKFFLHKYSNPMKLCLVIVFKAMYKNYIA